MPKNPVTPVKRTVLISNADEVELLGELMPLLFNLAKSIFSISAISALSPDSFALLSIN